MAGSTPGDVDHDVRRGSGCCGLFGHHGRCALCHREQPAPPPAARRGVAAPRKPAPRRPPHPRTGTYLRPTYIFGEEKCVYIPYPTFPLSLSLVRENAPPECCRGWRHFRCLATFPVPRSDRFPPNFCKKDQYFSTSANLCSCGKVRLSQKDRLFAQTRFGGKSQDCRKRLSHKNTAFAKRNSDGNETKWIIGGKYIE